MILTLETLWQEEAEELRGPGEQVRSGLMDSQSWPQSWPLTKDCLLTSFQPSSLHLAAWQDFTVKYVLSLTSFLLQKHRRLRGWGEEHGARGGVREGQTLQVRKGCQVGRSLRMIYCIFGTHVKVPGNVDNSVGFCLPVIQDCFSVPRTHTSTWGVFTDLESTKL